MVHGVAKQSVGHNLATNQPTIKMTALLLFNLPPTVLYPQPYYQDSKAKEKYKPPISSLVRHSELNKHPSRNSQQHLYLIKSPCQLKEEKCEMVPLKLSNFTSLSLKWTETLKMFEFLSLYCMYSNIQITDYNWLFLQKEEYLSDSKQHPNQILRKSKSIFEHFNRQSWFDLQSQVTESAFQMLTTSSTIRYVTLSYLPIKQK